MKVSDEQREHEKREVALMRRLHEHSLEDKAFLIIAGPPGPARDDRNERPPWRPGVR